MFFYIRHLVINSLAQAELERRRGIRATVLPNIFDFETPPPGPDAFNADLRAAIDLAPNDRFMLQPTRVVPRKGIELAIELLQRLGDPHCKLVITHHAGDEGTDYMRHLQALANRANVDLRYATDLFEPSRRLAPDGSKRYSLWDAYIQADFVTYPSLVEGFGNALVESTYFCLPALVNRYPVYVNDIAPLGFTFVEIEQAITDQTVAHVRRLLDGAELREAMTTHNFALGKKHFSYSVAEATLRQALTHPC